MTNDLLEGQYELDGLTFGEGTSYRVLTHETGGLPERVVQDVPAVGEDGVMFGRDYFGGSQHVFAVQARANPNADVRAAVRDFLTAWRGSDAVRRTPRAVQVLRWREPGEAQTWRVYGRSRNGTPTRSRNTGIGLVPIACDFAAVDDKVYDDTETSLEVTLSAGVGGGFRFPLRWPVVGGGSQQRVSLLENTGTCETWPVVTFHDLTAPSLELRDPNTGATLWRLALRGSLLPGTSVTIDTRPWRRTTTRSDGLAVPGARTRTSTPLADCQIPPGTWEAVLTGSQGQAVGSAVVTWASARPAH